MRVFFEAIFVTCQFTSQIGRLLIPRNPTQATSFLPGSVVIVPRGLHRVRFIFFDSYGLDVRFLAKSIITIEGRFSDDFFMLLRVIFLPFRCRHSAPRPNQIKACVSCPSQEDPQPCRNVDGIREEG